MECSLLKMKAFLQWCFICCKETKIRITALTGNESAALILSSSITMGEDFRVLMHLKRRKNALKIV
jgi:hypothetical protein